MIYSLASARRLAPLRGLPLLLAAVLAGACGGDSGPVTPPSPKPVATVAVIAPGGVMRAGAVARLTATVRDAAGNELTGRSIVWTSTADAVATVSGDGTVTAGAPGAVTIRATAEGKTGEAALTITPRPVGAVTVAAPPGIEVGTTLQLTAAVADTAGGPLTGREVAWSSSDASVASVSATGLVTGAGEGSATITANVEGKTAAAAITVIPVPIASLSFIPETASVEAGQTVQLRVVGRDAAGNELPGRPVTLSALDPDVARIGADGVVTGVAPGTATFRATAEGHVAMATVTVRPPSVATVVVRPNPVTVPAGESVRLLADLRDVSGSPLNGRTIAWSSSDPGTATVSATGVVTGIVAGTVTITATSEGKSGNAQVTVPEGDQSQPSLTSFSFAPAALDITSRPDTLFVTLGISDTGSGVGRIFGSVRGPNGQGFSINSCERVSGTDTNGTWRCKIFIPVGAGPGFWAFDGVRMVDQAGNGRIYSGRDLRFAGYAYTFQVTGGPQDNTAPTLTSFSFAPSAVDVASAPDTLFATFGITDASSGVVRMSASAHSPSGKGASTGWCVRVSGTDTNGAWRCEIIFPKASEGGTWTFDSVSVTDALENQRWYREADLRAAGYATTFQVTP